MRQRPAISLQAKLGLLCLLALICIALVACEEGSIAGEQTVPAGSAEQVIPTIAIDTAITRDVRNGGPNCIYSATWMGEAGVPDGDSLAPDQPFAKNWQLINNGTCTWEEGTVLFFAGGEPLGQVDEVSVPETAPGRSREVSVPMRAPETAGTYTSFWRLRMADGSELGVSFPVQITVVDSGTPDPTETMPAATATTAPATEPAGTPTGPPAAPTATPAPATPAPTAVPPSPTPEPEGGWLGEYYNNRDLLGAPFATRMDEEIDFDWGTGAPLPNLPSNQFSARWTQTLSFDEGRYTFFARSDDGVRVWVDDELVIDEWHQVEERTYQADFFLTAGMHEVRVEYFEAFQLAHVRVWWERQRGLAGWRGEYFDNASLLGEPVLVRDDPAVAFNWGLGAPGPGVPNDNFSVRWTRELYFPAGTYHFHTLVDDGMRLFVGDLLVIDAWQVGSLRQADGIVTLGEGEHRLRVEYYENTREAAIYVWWDSGGEFPDWRGEYWDNPTFQGQPTLVRNDEEIDFRWQFEPPVAGFPEDNFAVRWARLQNFEPGTYRFSVTAAGEVRVYVDGDLVIDRWFEGDPNQVLLAEVPLQGIHSIVVLFRDAANEAAIEFDVQRVGP